MSKKAAAYGFIVLAVVTVVAVLGLATNLTGLTGVLSFPSIHLCTDRWGVSYTSRDYVTKSGRNSYDRCRDNNILEEAMCAGTNVVYGGYDCRILGKICRNGACVNPSTPQLTRPPIPQKCIPKTCQSLGFQCGQASDGCGGILDCGACLRGLSCWNGKCQPPGKCAIDLDCGLNAPVGKPYCQGQNIYQEIMVYKCAIDGGGKQVMYTRFPGSTCINKTFTSYLFTCPSGTSCQQGLCFKHCSSDADCLTRDRTRDGVYINLSCLNGLCPLLTAEDMTPYGYCLDSDRTKPNLNIRDYFNSGDSSFTMPGYILTLQADSRMPARYIFDDLEHMATGTGFLREWLCQNSTTLRSYAFINCPEILPSLSSRLYFTSVFNQYLPYNVNVGFCG